MMITQMDRTQRIMAHGKKEQHYDAYMYHTNLEQSLKTFDNVLCA